ncbi:MAG: hydantoinase/carbamoylase family amidase [Reyranella sp.]|uniref:hydantoinase/carbamoylase family amidase n=1 Tax=Reyranella sp. TaxID=1929291 RepID=UPI0012011610|nr:hydantoinase/carbamoylase family amidase [Reyranella sp.]TAJ85556.1 MAG: hydantoinase/carbamoylase family amidase [Reyranella sp.]TBR24168.1 MAG: hydantoinase/carbamoylase family amidase [Reyranella sp.]
MPTINDERLLGDLRRIADFGRYQTGVHRPHLSPQDVESRHWLAARMKEAGLEPVIDGIGTVIGKSPKTGPRILIGSHSDTQPRGGWLDGVMGVIYGLEVARALAEDPETAHLAVDVASWADEEGHWGQMTGSRSFIGIFSEADIDKAKHRDEGTPMREALKAAGLEGVPREHLEEGRYRGYLEAHIEQGGLLEAGEKRIGIVTAIVGIMQFRLTFSGIQNHAGTTPMPIRKDAGVAMMRLYNDVMDKFPAVSGPRSVWTVGKMVLEPGAPAIVPGRAEMILQFRDADFKILQAFEAKLMEIVADHQKNSPCKVECVNLSRTQPLVMDERFLEAIEESAAVHAPDKHVRMPSGAGHDAQVIGLKMPAAMMFVPSIGGISHHFTENTHDADIVLGCQVFADAAAKILKGN